VKAPPITHSEAAVADIFEQADGYEAQADQKLAKRWEKRRNLHALADIPPTRRWITV
jgi:hypothetical protein